VKLRQRKVAVPGSQQLPGWAPVLGAAGGFLGGCGWGLHWRKHDTDRAPVMQPQDMEAEPRCCFVVVVVMEAAHVYST
jgi:hypothetical protein